MTEQAALAPKPKPVLSPLQHNDPSLPNSGDTVERSGRTWVVETVADQLVTLHLAGRTNVVKFIPFWVWRQMYPQAAKTEGAQP